MSTHARPLAVWLAAATDAQLSTLLASRGVRTDVAWNDFFDAAEALLEPAAIERLLPLLTRAEAAALAREVASGAPEDAEAAASLRALALVREDGGAYPTVAEAVATRPTPAEADESPMVPATPDAAAHAAERALTTVAALAELLLFARDTPLALLTAGAVSASEKRRFAEAGIAADRVDDLLALALTAGLSRADGRVLRITPDGEHWLRTSASERWARLAEGFRAALPRGVRSAEGGWIGLAAWPSAHPWDPTWPRHESALRHRAALLGLIADDGGEPEWSVPLREGRPADTTALERKLPTEVDRIFLQNDLTAIAPGPLAPGLDVRLRTLAERESAAQASSYRFTAESIAHALVVGETEASILAFLEELSLTGIPQPLKYLVAQTAQRHGLVQVSEDRLTGRTRIRSVDAHLIDAMAVDQALRPLALVREGRDLTTRVGRDTAYWALTDARYPATTVAADGTAVAVDRNPVPSAPPAEPPTYAPLLARLRARRGPDADAAWLDRELEAAVRTRAQLRVEVGMPDGSTRELVLEASGLGGGRLRGRDRAADVERTLPVSSIRSVSVIDVAEEATS